MTGEVESPWLFQSLSSLLYCCTNIAQNLSGSDRSGHSTLSIFLPSEAKWKLVCSWTSGAFYCHGHVCLDSKPVRCLEMSNLTLSPSLGLFASSMESEGFLLLDSPLSFYFNPPSLMVSCCHLHPCLSGIPLPGPYAISPNGKNASCSPSILFNHLIHVSQIECTDNPI